MYTGTDDQSRVRRSKSKFRYTGLDCRQRDDTVRVCSRRVTRRRAGRCI